MSVKLTKKDKEDIKDCKVLLKELSLDKKPKSKKSKKTKPKEKDERAKNIKYVSAAYKAIAKKEGTTFAQTKESYKGNDIESLKTTLTRLNIKPIYKKYTKAQLAKKKK